MNFNNLLRIMKTTKYYAVTLMCATIIMFSGSLFGNILFLMYDEALGTTTKVIRPLKVVSAKVNPKDSRVYFELENTKQERWWHTSSTIRHSECPKLEYQKLKNVYIVTYETRFTGKKRYEAEGVSTFCWPGYQPTR